MTMDLKVNDDFTTTQAFVVEAVGTYILVWCIISAGEFNAGRLSGAISATAALFVILKGVGYVSGPAYNPSIALGIVISDAYNHGWDRLDDIWIYMAPTVLGGMIAAGWWFVMMPGINKDACGGYDPETPDFDNTSLGGNKTNRSKTSNNSPPR